MQSQRRRTIVKPRAAVAAGEVKSVDDYLAEAFKSVRRKSTTPVRCATRVSVPKAPVTPKLVEVPLQPIDEETWSGSVPPMDSSEDLIIPKRGAVTPEWVSLRASCPVRLKPLVSTPVVPAASLPPQSPEKGTPIVPARTPCPPPQVDSEDHRKPAEPVAKSAEPVAKSAEPVAKSAEPVAKSAEPVHGSPSPSEDFSLHEDNSLHGAVSRHLAAEFGRRSAEFFTLLIEYNVHGPLSQHGSPPVTTSALNDAWTAALSEIKPFTQALRAAWAEVGSDCTATKLQMHLCAACRLVGAEVPGKLIYKPLPLEVASRFHNERKALSKIADKNERTTRMKRLKTYFMPWKVQLDHFAHSEQRVMYEPTMKMLFDAVPLSFVIQSLNAVIAGGKNRGPSAQSVVSFVSEYLAFVTAVKQHRYAQLDKENMAKFEELMKRYERSERVLNSIVHRVVSRYRQKFVTIEPKPVVEKKVEAPPEVPRQKRIQEVLDVAKKRLAGLANAEEAYRDVCDSVDRALLDVGQEFEGDLAYIRSVVERVLKKYVVEKPAGSARAPTSKQGPPAQRLKTARKLKPSISLPAASSGQPQASKRNRSHIDVVARMQPPAVPAVPLVTATNHSVPRPQLAVTRLTEDVEELEYNDGPRGGDTMSNSRVRSAGGRGTLRGRTYISSARHYPNMR